MRSGLALLMLLAVAACAPQQPELRLVPSERSAVELRSMQSRIMEGEKDTVFRGVIATLADLGYRVTRAEAPAGTVSAVKQGRLTMTVTVQPHPGNRSVVRANAGMQVAPAEQRQVDDPAFYQQNFFAVLASTLGTQAFALPEGASPPEPLLAPVAAERSGASGRPVSPSPAR